MSIDIQALQRKIRTELEIEDLLLFLDRAVDLIPQERLSELVKNFFDPDSLSLVEGISDQVLLNEVRIFVEESMSGIYYEDFRVNSRNFMDLSRGTINFIAEFRRLMQRCIAESEAGDQTEIREAFEMLIKLLDEIDECRDDIIFFADEAGAWQVGVDWDKVLPCYCKSLAAVAKPKEYAQSIFELVRKHVDYHSDKYLQQALKIANPSQKKALKALMQ
ncbi:MAG: hypothetical protein WCA35_15890 [Kovacikia sp.]